MAHNAAIWALLPIARDRAVHQTRVQQAQHPPSKAEPFHDPRSEAFQEDVGPLDEPSENLFAALGLEIQRKALFVSVEEQETSADRRIAPERSRRPRVVAAPGFFDFDDFGTKIGKQERAVRSG
jgi:hypothetical protein